MTRPAAALAEALEQDRVDRLAVAGRRRRRERAELARPAHAAGVARDRVQRAVVLQQVDAPAAEHRRELEQHLAAHRPGLAVGRARRAPDREMVRARLRVAVDRPRKAVVGGMLVGTRARGGRGGRVLVGVHEPDIRVERVVVAVEHRQRDADPEHEEHGPDREPRKRTLAAGRRAHPKDGRGRAGRVRRSRNGRPGATLSPWMTCASACASCPAASGCSPPRRACAGCISSAARCATCCSGARRASSTSSSKATSRRSRRASAPAAKPGRSRTSASRRRPCGWGSAAGTWRARGPRPTRAPVRCPTCAPRHARAGPRCAAT